MEISCKYCLNPFNATENIPFILSCKHLLCSSCLDFLKNWTFSYSCPFDKTRIEADCFPRPIIVSSRTETVNSNHCKIHKKPYACLCLNHIEILCSACANSHSKCQKMMGDSNELNTKICEFLNYFYSKTQLEIKNLFENIILDATDGYLLTQNFINNTIEKIKEIKSLDLDSTSFGSKLNYAKKISEIENIDLNELNKSLDNWKKLYKEIESIFKQKFSNEEMNDFLEALESLNPKKIC